MSTEDGKRLETRLLSQTTKACADFDLLRDGDHVAVAISGGKDSYTLLHLLMQLQRRAPFSFALTAVNLDQCQPGFDAVRIEAHLRAVGVSYVMLKDDTYATVTATVEPGKTMCWMCGRLRRAVLYSAAVGLGCNKIALGHHRDDLIESLLMSAFYAGVLKSMPAKLKSDDGRNTIIRPMVYCAEGEIAAFAAAKKFPIVPCNLCGNQPDLKRKRVKKLLDELEAENSNVKANLLHALGAVVPAHLLDRRLYDFAAMAPVDPRPAEASSRPALPIVLDA
ncbi:MAG: tRNA 2-thiocytidine(32) synthetase TtcA [Deltaproteobacteria bacterium]|nr:tRNA 2-thiocytidine(32) synthetase TtcA [Deltaproteobacteria bacterium]